MKWNIIFAMTRVPGTRVLQNVVSALPVLVSAYFYAVKLVLVGLKMARVWPWFRWIWNSTYYFSI